MSAGMTAALAAIARAVLRLLPVDRYLFEARRRAREATRFDL